MGDYGVRALALALLLGIAAARVGERCKLQNGGIGECRLVKSCPQTMGKRLNTFNICGWYGIQSIICCPEISPTTTVKTETSALIPDEDDIVFQPDEEIIDENQLTSTTIASRLPEIVTNNKRICVQECEKLHSIAPLALGYHILNGEEAEVGEFPHMAAIGFMKDTGLDYDCGGTLISKNYVLTAAHCTTRNTPSVVKLGQIDLKSPSMPNSDYEVESVTVHPNYRRQFNYHDLALLKLKNDVSFNENIYPACLYTNLEDIKKEMVITGWGNTNATKEMKSDLLLKAYVKSVDLQTCNETYTVPKLRRLPDGLVAGQLCAVDEKSDTCQGDSGGPLQTNHTTKDNIFFLVGVTSFGKNCGSQIPAVYSRVAFYLDWIESVVWPKN